MNIVTNGFVFVADPKTVVYISITFFLAWLYDLHGTFSVQDAEPSVYVNQSKQF